MKSILILTASLFVLAIFFAVFIPRDSKPERAETPPPTSAALEEAQANDSSATPRTPSTIRQSTGSGWKEIQSENLTEYISRLQAMGCPSATIRDIIIGEINRRFQPRFATVRTGAGAPFWRTLERATQPQEQDAAKQELMRREVERERNTLAKNLLGIDWDDYFAVFTGKPDAITRILDTVPESVRSPTRRILERYAEMENTISDRCGGTLGLAEQAEMEQLYRAKIRELKSILSPNELEEFELRASPLAFRLRTADLVGFSPTEQEFRDIFRITNLLEGPGGQVDHEQSAQNSETMLREVLGPERFAAYQRSQDLTYRRLVEFASLNGLGTEVAAQVHDTREAVIQEVDALRNRPTSNETNPTRDLVQIQADAEKAVRTMLGEDAYSKYLTTQLGRWVSLIPTWTNGVVFRE